MQAADSLTARQTKRYISGMSGLLKLLPFFHLVQTNLYSGDNSITNVLRWLIMCTIHHLRRSRRQAELMNNSCVYNLIVLCRPYFLIRCLESKINFNYQPNKKPINQPTLHPCLQTKLTFVHTHLLLSSDSFVHSIIKKRWQVLASERIFINQQFRKH